MECFSDFISTVHLHYHEAKGLIHRQVSYHVRGDAYVNITCEWEGQPQSAAPQILWDSIRPT
jgi:hypothetical protein